MDTWLSENYLLVISLVLIQSTLLLGSTVIIAKLLKKQSTHSKQIYQITNELKAINSGNVGIGRKINLVSKEIASVELDKLTNAPTGSIEKSYQQASILLKRGASIEEVVASCEIAPDEAELLSIMTHASETSNQQSNHKNYSLAS